METKDKDVIKAGILTGIFIAVYDYALYCGIVWLQIVSLTIFVIILYMSYLISKLEKRLEKYKKGVAKITEELEN